MGLEEHQFGLLKRKLDALNYTHPVEAVSAPLVQALLDDLVHTTEAYRALKLETNKQGQQIYTFDNQVEELELSCRKYTTWGVNHSRNSR